MDGFCPEPSEENNHKEHTGQKRRSSILKPPRSPLQDIRSGNEIGQDFITTRSRKSSRRVSFAETIKVFQTEIPTEVKGEPKNTGLAVGEKVSFKQAKRTEDNQCEIIGMETLLRAPIQVQLQQQEGSDTEPIREKKYRNDQTVIFSDENQMELTASHTVMITKDLLSCPEMGKPSKIDTKSFLANLKSHTEDLTMNKEFNLSTDPERIADKCSFQSKTSTSSENKVNFNDFIKRLKLEKSISSCTEGPEKENVFIAHTPSQEPNNDAFSLPKKYVFSNAKENSHGVTGLFREQDDGKDVTQCHTDNIQSMDPITRETPLRPAEGCDFTVYGNDFMDLTVNHTAQNFLPINNISRIEKNIQSVTMDVTKSDYTTKNPGTKRICRNQQNVPCQDPSGNLEDEKDITRSHTGMTDTHPVASQASNQGSVTLALAPKSTCPGLVFQGDKTTFFSSNDDAMEMTKSLTPRRDDKNACVSNLTQMYPNSGKAISSFMDKTVYSEEVDMHITESNTVAIHDQIVQLCSINVQVPSLPNLENELLFQDQEAVSEDIKQNKSYSSVSYVTTGRLQQDLANPLSVSLSGNKSVEFSGEDMDLTKCCTVKIDSSDLGTQLPLTSANTLAPVKTKKPLSPRSRHSSGLETWEEMEITKSHTVPINIHNNAVVTQQKPGPKNTQTETCIKDEKILEFSSYPDKDILHSSVYKIDMTKSHTIDICGENLDRKVALGNTGNAHFHKQSWLSKVKPITFSSEDDMERHTIDINTCPLKSTLAQNSRLSEPLKKNVANTSLAFCHDKTVVFMEQQQNMDLTTSHTAVIGCMPCPSIQESGDMVPQNIIFKPQSEFQNDTNLLSNLSVRDFVRNNAVVIQMEEPSKIDTKSFLANLKSHTEDLTMNKELNESTDPERIADKCSFQSKTSTSSENKVNFNDFIKRLKLEKSVSSCTEGPEKENVFIAHTPSQEPNNDAFSLPKKYVFSNAKENSHGVTGLFREQDDGKDVTQCHTDNIQSIDPITRETPLRPAEGCDFTVYGNDFMDLTVNHTAQNFLPTNNISRTENHIQSVTVDVMKSESVVFSGEDMDLTKCCTVKIDSSDLGTQLPLTSANVLAPVKTKKPLSPNSKPTSQIVLQQIPFPLKEAFNSFLQDKGDLHSEKSFGNCQNSLSQPENLRVANTDVSPEYTHQSLLAMKLVSTNSLLPYPSEKTIIFAPEQDNMDLTENYEVIIQTGNSKIPADEQQKQKYSEASVRYGKSSSLTLSCLNKKRMTEIMGDSSEINKIHTIGEDKADLEEETSRTTDETVVFPDNQDELEITKSHTVVIDYQTMKKMQGGSHPKDSRRKSLGQPKMIFAPNDQTVFFSEEGGNDLDLTKSRTTGINSQIVPQGDSHGSIPVDKTIMFTSNNDMELTKPIPCMIDKTVERPRLENAQLLDKPGGSKSMNEFYSNKTVVFPADDENNMEISSALTKEINHKDVLEGEQDSCLVPLATASKTVLYRGEEDDMEIMDITKSHIFAMDCEADLQDVGTSRKMDKTVVFADNQDELEITKSHTVVIDYQTMKKIKDRSNLKSSGRKSLGGPKMTFTSNDQTVFFSEEDGNDLDLTKSHTTGINSQIVPQGDSHRSIPVDKTIMFTSNNDRELTKPIPCTIDKTVERPRLQNAQLLDKPGGSKNMNEFYSNKTVVFPADDENNMEISSALTKEINHKDVLEGEQDSCLVPLAAASKTVLYRGEQDDMEITDITKSHIIAMDCEAVGTSRKMDKTVVFADNQNELEITKSHTVVIDYQTMKKTKDRSNLKSSGRKSLDGPKMTFTSNDQTVFFSEEDGNDLDLTKSHTTVINSQIVPQGDGHRNIPVDKTIMFTSNNDMELTKLTICITDKTIEDPGLDPIQLLEKPKGKKSINNRNSDKTIVFSATDENGMEITNICAMEINHEGQQDSCLAPLATASKTVLYKGKQDNMELTDITKSHIFAMECEADLQDVGTSRKMDKTVVFADNQDELEITKSHTVVIDYQTVKKMQGGSHPKDSRRKSLGRPKMIFAPNDQTVFFSEEGGNDLDLTKSHTTVINSQIVPQGDSHGSIPVDKTIMFTSNNDMELTKPIPCMIDKTVERPRLQNAQLLDKPGGSKSMNEFYSNKTVVFPADDENNMEISSALTKEINHKDVLEGEQDGCLVPLAAASKTVLYRGEQDDMEITDITKSHIFAMDCEAVGTSRKMDKTVVFADNQNELEITKSHTVVIDYQTMENTQNMLPGKAKPDSFKKNSLVGAQATFVPNNETIFLSSEDVNDQKVTKKQTDAIENRSFLQDEQQKSALPFFPADKTIMFTGDQVVMEMDRSESTVINEKTLKKVVDQDHILETVKKEVCAFGSTILLGKITKSKSKTIPFKFPKHQVKTLNDDGEQRQRSELFRDAVLVDSQPQLLSHSIPLPEKEQYIVNEDKLMQPEAENGNLEVATGNLCVLNYENKSKMLHNDRELTTASEKEPKQNVQISEWEATVEIHVNSGSATEVHQLYATHSTLSDPVISSKAISTANVEPNLNTVKRSEIFSQSQTSHIANLAEQLPKLGKQVEDSVDKSQITETQNTKIGINNAENVKDEGKPYSCNGDASVLKDKIKARRYSLGIFLPKLPNKRNCSVSGMDALEHNSVDLTDLNRLETQLVTKKNSNLMSALTEPHLSPSQYINEEHLPLDPEESNSSESISIETKGKALTETCQQEIQPPESTVKEIFNSQKRLLVQGEDDSVPSEKKVRKDETSISNSAQALQALDHHTEEYVDKNPCSSLMKNLNRTPSSCSSSSDSIKADGTSMNYSIQQSSQMESQFLMDHICEETLKEKLHDGRITVREFFTLLQVHILIQKPRQSNLPANFATNVPSTPKDLMLSQYVYRPKIQIYKEDCQALHQKIEELKLHALKQDKLLVDVNRSLWEVMKDCSDEELKTFGAHLNKMKSRFAKKTKVFAHQGKVVLYSKLVQSAKIEREKLQTRMDKMDSVLKEVDTCLAALDLEIKNLDKNEEDIPMAEWDSEMLATEKELEQLQAEEEELKRNISEVEIERQQALAQINSLRREASKTKECLEKFNCSEWEIIEWSDSQAVFTFLYDSIELTITFGEPVDGLPFLSKTCRKIVDINFETLLHENKAPPSSLLVHRLIFQFIEDQGSWKNKCITQHHVPKMLQEISLVVSRCRLLGEEIEFLNRWGPNYNLMNIDVNNTEVKLLFSSSAAFAKFELTLTLSAHYPSVPLSFTIQNLIGNIDQDKIAAILSNVPLDNSYLKTAVKYIYQDLLQGPHLHH